jgi:hypothetical protein
MVLIKENDKNEEELLTYNLYSKEVTLRRKINEIKNDKDDSSRNGKVRVIA